MVRPCHAVPKDKKNKLTDGFGSIDTTTTQGHTWDFQKRDDCARGVECFQSYALYSGSGHTGK